MFEDYIQDAYSFYELACIKEQDHHERDAKMYFRASVFCAASSLEAFINLIGETFKQGNTLDKIETAFLNDKILEISPAMGIIEENIKFHPIEAKIKFILKKFEIPIELGKYSQWKDFIEFKELRNSLVHAKPLSDEKSIADYKASIKKGLNANIDIMNAISRKIFSRPLRKGLTDLKI